MLEQQNPGPIEVHGNKEVGHPEGRPMETSGIRRLANLGVVDQPPAWARRIRIINVVALIAISINLTYIAFFVVLGASGVLLMGDIGPVVASNSLSIVGGLSVLRLNHVGRTDGAMWLEYLTAIFNTTSAVFLVGNSLPVEVFFPVLAAFTMLITRPGDRRTQLLMLAGTIVAFLLSMSVDTETPPSLANPALADSMLLANTIGSLLFTASIAFYFRMVVDRAESDLEVEKDRSENLLLNILPREIADRLKAGETTIADRVGAATVLFADIVDSTPLSEELSADQMVEFLNSIFTEFDGIADELELEKIKTIGDSYMVVGGVPRDRPDHVEAVAEMALRMRSAVDGFEAPFGPIRMRFGIDTGPLVAGVIGTRKFSYDLWGETVNTAARMESHGIPGEIQVTERVRRTLDQEYSFRERGPVPIKGKGVLTTHLLTGRKPDPSQPSET